MKPAIAPATDRGIGSRIFPGVNLRQPHIARSALGSGSFLAELRLGMKCRSADTKADPVPLEAVLKENAKKPRHRHVELVPRVPVCRFQMAPLDEAPRHLAVLLLRRPPHRLL